MSAGQKRPRRCRLLLCLLALPASVLGLVVIAMLGFALAIGGTSDQHCATDRQAGPAGPRPSHAAVSDMPPARLAIYQRAGRAENIDWTFLASIGAQECNHGTCRGDNGSGCAGPMQIAVRRGSPCSPGPGPTLWDRYRVDGNHDGHTDVNDPADAIFTAARVLRREKHAPPTGGTYAQYRQAACNYYGACADAAANYADQVMHRAIAYGFHRNGNPNADELLDRLLTDTPPTGCPSGPGPTAAGAGNLGKVQRLRAPRRLQALPASAIAPGFGPIRCDARIISNVVYLARRFRVRVTACASIHSLSGEHPLGTAIDAVPAPGATWANVERLARAIGWKPGCAASGVAPGCARPPFRFIGYNGYPNHGDPAHCIPCGGGPHLHLSWNTSASQGGPESRPRVALFSPSWIDVFNIASGERPRASA